MKLARSNDVWRSLYKKTDRPVEFVELAYIDAAGGPELSIRLDAPLSLLCGENGVGKSRAMRALHAALGGALGGSDFRPRVGPSPPNVVGVRALVRPFVPPNTFGEAFEVNDSRALAAYLTDDRGLKVHWFDPTLQIPYLLHILRHDRSLSDLWEGVRPKQLDAAQLEDVSSLVGRTYSKLEIFEIEDYTSHEVVPYFRATSHGVTYGAEDMGLGELSLLFLYWMLGRISPASAFLLEEPETFIAPHSQRMLIDIVARDCSDKKLFVVLTSHSGVIAERVPRTHVDLLTRRGREVTFSRDPSRRILTDRLGLVPPRSVFCLVEDSVSASFLTALLEAGNSKYLSSAAVFQASGEGGLVNVLKGIRIQPGAALKIVGILDGDRRNTHPDGVEWPVIYLPGETSPEAYFRDHLNAHFADLEQILGFDRRSVNAAFDTADGMEVHAWLRTVCAGLQISLDELIRKVARSIGRADAAQLQRFIAAFEGAVDGRQKAVG